MRKCGVAVGPYDGGGALPSLSFMCVMRRMPPSGRCMVTVPEGWGLRCEPGGYVGGH